MITRCLLLCLSSLYVSDALNCHSCGVFLSASTPECRGEPKNTSCEPDNLGCLKVTGENEDGSFYVEKRCAAAGDDLHEGCYDIGIRGIRATQCICKDDLCNSKTALFSSTSVILGGALWLFQFL